MSKIDPSAEQASDISPGVDFRAGDVPMPRSSDRAKCSQVPHRAAVAETKRRFRLTPLTERVKGVGPNLLGTITVQGVGVITAVVVARLYSPAGRGEIAAAVSWLLLFSAIADIGISQAVPFYAARGEAGTARSAQLVCVLAALVFTPPLLFVPALVGFEMSTSAYAYAVGGIFFSSSMNYIGCLFQGQGRNVAATVVRLYCNLPYVFAVLMVSIDRTSPEGLLLRSLLISTVLWLLLMVWSLRAGALAGSATISIARKLSGYGLRTYLSSLAWIGSQRIPPLIIGARAGESALGLFAVAQSMATVPFIVASSFALTVHSRVGAAKPEQRRRVVRSLLANSACATAVATLATAPLGYFALEFVFGSDYAPARPVAVILTVASGLFGMNFVLTTLLRALDRPILPTWAELLGLATNLALGSMATSKWGLRGSAIIIAVSATLVCVTLSVMMRTAQRKEVDVPATSEDV